MSKYSKVSVRPTPRDVFPFFFLRRVVTIGSLVVSEEGAMLTHRNVSVKVRDIKKYTVRKTAKKTATTVG